MILTPMLRRLQLQDVSNSTIFLRVNLKVSLRYFNLIETDFLDTLYKLTKDADPLVVINAIEAINEILSDKGGIEVTR